MPGKYFTNPANKIQKKICSHLILIIMKTKNHKSINLTIYKLFLLLFSMLLTFSGKSQCDLEGNVMVYEFEEHERIYYKVPEDFDYKSQIQLDLLKLREKSKKVKRSIKIDKNYKLTDNIVVLETKNHFEKQEVRLLNSVYTEKEIKIISGLVDVSKNTQKETNQYVVTKERDNDYQNEFYIRKLNYLNGHFGWLNLDEDYFQILEKRGYLITTENQVITAQNENDKIIYDEANLIYYREYYDQGIKYTRFMKYYKLENNILPRFIKLTESQTLFNGDCVEKVTELSYPEDKTSLCISEPEYALPRSISNPDAQSLFYPNPVMDEFTINNPYKSQDVEVYIYDIYGKVVVKESFSNSSDLLILNAGKLNTGMHVVNLVSGKESVSFKLIKN